jgi:TonB-dependent receptor
MLQPLKAGVCFAALIAADLAMAAPVPAPDAPVTAEEPVSADIVVTGTRQGEAKAIGIKKESLNIVEALYANDVGKLPDQNVAEAVKRLPGLTVANDQGEGRYVVIRGINPNLVNVTLNGLTLPAPEPDGRQVKLDDIPSALISSVVVTKAITADQDANAIGGAVDIRTLTAFDRNKAFFFDARAAYGWAALGSNHPWEADAQTGGIFGSDGQFGAVLSFNYSKRPIESENFQGSTTFLANGGPDQYGLRDYNLTRTRIGAVANFDWHASDTVKLFTRLSYSKFKDDEVRDQNRVDQLVYAANGTYTGRGSILIRRRQEDDNTKSAQLGGNFDFGAAGKLDITGAYTRAIKNDPLRSEYNFRAGNNSVTGAYDLSDAPYGFTISPAINPASYPLNSVNYDKRHAQEDLWQIRADYTLPIGLGDDSNIKAGAKYLNRHKTNNRDYQQYSRGTVFNASSATYIGALDFYDGAYVLGPRISYDAAQAYAAANPTALTQTAANINSSRNNSQVNDYDVREKIAAAYVMATLQFGGLTLLPGVRMEHTQDDQKAKLFRTGTGTVDQDFNSFTGQSYTDFFPSLSAKFAVTPSFLLRGAVTTSIGRPNYPDLSPYVSVDTTTTPRQTITLGNPDLKPYKAWSADLAAEYYLPGQGLISVGLFYKHLKNPIYTASILNTSGTFGGQTFTGVDLSQAVNIDKAFVRGIEGNIQKRFDFLPSPLDGFGLSANFTHVTGHSSGSIPGATPRTGDIPLFLQSKDSGTVQIFYEKYGVAIRAAYTYRSKYLDTLGASAATDQYTDHNGQLDLNASYQVTPQLIFFANASNLNDAAWRRFIGTKSQLVERERYDYTVRWGAQLHF